MTATEFPRVSLPGVDEEAVERVQSALREAAEHEAHLAREQTGMVQAMLRLGRPPARPARKRRPKPTKHVRQMRARAARAYVLQGKENA